MAAKNPLTILAVSFVVFVVLIGAAVWLYEQSQAQRIAPIVPGQAIPLSQKMETLQQLAASSNQTIGTSSSETISNTAAEATTSAQATPPTPEQQKTLDSLSQSSQQSQPTNAQKMQTLQALNSQ